ncbi:PREDICTED: ribosomal RNA-processing protein 17 [Trachymyrmex cornetzi]|uniref:Nucleolar protein 12 n=1 Tax=Trachymyrmex cornetzi TaxID=471704 RepID=A0A195DF21_9HYME|nr:PREDICTED: ribosomal RNA-processing protein 17 [Trachymyrmex cornetzi]KYN11498.1 Nucleolar protein 12 [Trachymyrmex cornetzi]
MFKNSQPQLLNVNRKPSQPKRRKKITLVFDEEKRREFLGGFRKRKLERKRKAQEQLQQQLKEERKKIKQEARERYKKSLSNQVVPELQELLSQQELDLGSHTVSILELNVADLKEGKKWIGENKIVEEKEQENDKSDKSCNDDDDDDEIVGMSLQEKCKNRVQPKSKSNSYKIKSAKELKQEIKKAALKRVKNSKAFQQKQRLEQQKNKKQKQKLQKAQELVYKRGKRSKKKSRH